MQKINTILDKINLMQKPIFPNIEHSQQNNSADSENSDDNHEESLHFEEDQVMEIPTYENEGDLKNKDELVSQETVEETEKDEVDIDQDKDLHEADLNVDEAAGVVGSHDHNKIGSGSYSLGSFPSCTLFAKIGVDASDMSPIEIVTEEVMRERKEVPKIVSLDKYISSREENVLHAILSQRVSDDYKADENGS